METELLKYILDNRGSAVTADLLFNLCDTTTLSELLCNDDKFVSCLFNGTPKVVVRSTVRLCWRKDCLGCGALHLCKGFLLTGSCQFTFKRRGCLFSHDILSAYNENILEEFGLETLSRAQLCVLLLQSNNNLLPSICYNYNNLSGCQDSCPRLHICQKFLSQDCSCFRTHDFQAPQPLKVLQDRHIPESLFKSLKSVYANKEALRLADKIENRRKGGDRGGTGDPQDTFGFDSPNDGDYDTGFDADPSGDAKASRGRGARGRRGHSRGGRGRRGRRQDLSSQASTGGFVNNNDMSDLPCGDAADTDDMLGEDGSDASAPFPARASKNRGGRGGLGKGNSTGTRGRGGRGNAGNDAASGDKDKTEICLFFIKGHCKHEADRCYKAHDKMPYRWQIRENGKWTPMAGNENIEQAYCNPENAYSTTSPPVYFDAMKSGDKEVRRLSTANSVKEPTFMHTTDWLWFWEDDHGKWLQYGAHASVHESASITCKQLEEKYQSNNTDVVQFKAGPQSYELSFQDMIQTNVRYGTKRIVRRRPKFVCAAEVQTKKNRQQTTPTTNPTPFPDYWDKTEISPTGHRCISLLPSLGEYREIQDLFCQTMKGFDVLKIERVQNKAIWEAFQLHKNQLKDKNSGQPVTEKKLFHGTEASLVDTICAANFDWRLCGVNGTAYGQGSYFARDAKYSHSYTGSSDVRFMFVSRVLVGEYTKGRSEYRRPPSKDGGGVNLYDSCVDDVTNPSIFVVFEKLQIYPEYVIQYRERDRPTSYRQVPASTAATASLTPSSAASPSANALVSNLTSASPTRSSNTAVSNTATASSTVPLNVTQAHSLTPATQSSSSAAAYHSAATSSASASSRLASAQLNYSNSPSRASTSSSPNYYRANLTASSNSYMDTSDPFFRYEVTLQQARSNAARARSQARKESSCVIA